VKKIRDTKSADSYSAGGKCGYSDEITALSLKTRNDRKESPPP